MCEELMANWPKLPEDMEEWLEEQVFKGRYLFYRVRPAAKKGTFAEWDRIKAGRPLHRGWEAYCSHCQRWVDMEPEAGRPIAETGYACPACGTLAVCKPYGRGRGTLYEEEKVLVIQTAYGRVYAQTVEVRRYWETGDRRITAYHTCSRWTFDTTGAKKYVRRWPWHNGGTWVLLKAVTEDMDDSWIYPLPDLRGTVLEHAHLQEYIDLSSGFRLMEYAAAYCKTPGIEHLVAPGLVRVVCHKLLAANKSSGMCWEHSTGWEGLRMNWRGRRPRDILRIDQPALLEIQKVLSAEPGRALIGYEGAYMKWRIWAAQNRLQPSDEELAAARRFVRERRENGQEWEAPRALKYLRYMAKQHARNSAIRPGDYTDYLKECEKLKLDLHDPRVRWPADLGEAHRRTAAAVKYEADQKLRKEMETMQERLAAFSWQADGLLIRPAATQEELTAEGKQLQHCVGGYAQAHLSGKSIFFVRKVAAPETPYYTLQLDIKTRRVLQNRGYRNCSRTEAVAEFEEKWLVHIKGIKLPAVKAG